MKVHIYVEGGGKNKALVSECRRGFKEFLEKAGCPDNSIRIIARGARSEAFKSYKIALESASGSFPLLLVDSEAPIDPSRELWPQMGPNLHGNWRNVPGIEEEQLHLMVQCMESWFLADRDALASYFRKGFVTNVLPQNPNVEAVDKSDVLEGLRKASRATAKGAYAKGRDSFRILASLDPSKVRGAARHADRLVKTLKSILERVDRNVYQ